MLNQERMNRVMERLSKENLEQMLICDPLAIFWLTGKWIFPGERFLGLLLKKSETPVLFINRLFEFKEDLGVKVIWYSDGEDTTTLVKKEINPAKLLGVDKIMESRFLLPLMEAHAASGFVNGSIAVDMSRAVKDSREQELMRISSKVNDQAMARFKALVHEGVSEIEIADRTLHIYKELGASGYSFDPIVSFGANAADPHHMPDDTVLKEGDCVLFDIGCKVSDYCSDMTRTFYYKKEPDERVRKIYQLVRRANETAEAAVRPGVERASIDKIARDIITEGGYGEAFNHRLGHFIGLQDHEFGDISQSDHHLLEAGNIHSIEPGIYLSGDTGVRIEDLVLVTENGHEILNHYPHDLEVID